MDRRTFLGTLVGSLLTPPLIIEAQQAGKVWRIGYLSPGFNGVPGSNPGLAPFLLLVAVSTPGALAAKQATSTIPIVMASVGEPGEVRLVDSLAHPGANITGLSLIAPQLAAKRLDLLRQALPKLSCVTVLWNSANQGMRARFQEAQAGAQSLGIAIQSVTV